MSRARDLADGTFSGAFSADSPTLVVDAANNRVGVGTASPTGTLSASDATYLSNTSTLGSSITLNSENTASWLGTRELISFESIGNGADHRVGTLSIKLKQAASDTTLTEYYRILPVYNYHSFYTAGSERVRLGNGYDNNGSLYLGNYVGAGIYDDPGYNNSYGITFRNLKSDYPAIMTCSSGAHYFYKIAGGVVVYFNYKSSISASDVGVGSISIGSSSTSYNTSSDYRLKEDWQPMSGSIDRVKALNPVNFAWKIDGSRVDGFLAHEVSDVVPEAITGTKDGMKTEEYEITPAVLDDDGNVVTEAVMGTREVPEYQGIDQSKLVPLLTAAIKEQQALIEDLQTRLAALEAV